MDISNLTSTEQQHSRVDYVCEIIKDKIIHLEWQPGDKINENDLAKSIEVSRVTVREALSKLEEARILERKHWKGYQLRKLSIKEIINTLEIRLLIELFAYRKFFENYNPEVVQHLEHVINEAEYFVSIGDLINYRKSDFKFHKLLYHLSGNEWVPVILDRLYFIIDIVRFKYSVGSKNEAQRSIVQHREIVDFMKNRDFDKVLESAEQHHKAFQDFIKTKINEEESVEAAI